MFRLKLQFRSHLQFLHLNRLPDPHRLQVQNATSADVFCGKVVISCVNIEHFEIHDLPIKGRASIGSTVEHLFKFPPLDTPLQYSFCTFLSRVPLTFKIFFTVVPLADLRMDARDASPRSKFFPFHVVLGKIRPHLWGWLPFHWKILALMLCTILSSFE